MEARASLNGTSVSKTFIAAILVLVAMGLGVMGGYVAKGLGAGTTGAQTQVVRPAAGTVLRQDNPPAAQASSAPTRIQKDDPYSVDTQPIHSLRGGH